MEETIASGATLDVAVGRAADEPVPERIGRYRVVALLGRGGMGSVYEAEDDELDRRVAIKLLHPRSSRCTSSAPSRRPRCAAPSTCSDRRRRRASGDASVQTVELSGG